MEIRGQLSAIILPVQEEDIVELILGSVEHYKANLYKLLVQTTCTNYLYKLLVHPKCALSISI